jgi:hypothetical protein
MYPLWSRVLGALAFFFMFAECSWLCLFRTRQVQRYAVELTRLHRSMNREQIQSPAYLRQLRLGGLGCGIVALFILYGLIMVLIGRQ